MSCQFPGFSTFYKLGCYCVSVYVHFLFIMLGFHICDIHINSISCNYVVSMATIGLTGMIQKPGQLDNIEQCNVETFQNYAERLEQYFIANDVAEEKRAATLLSCIGAKIYQLLRSLTSPDLPSTKSYDELKVVLNKHLSPQPLESFRFHKRNQREGESIQAYTVEIKRLSEHCNFGPHLDQSLRDRLVCGLSRLSRKDCSKKLI